MKRRLTAFAIMLSAILLVKLGLPVLAEVTSLSAEGYVVALTDCEGYDAPVSATVTKELTGDGEWTYKEFTFMTPFGANGEQRARAAITMAANRELTSEEWQSVSSWVGGVISSAVPSTVGIDAGTMAEKIVRAVNSERASDENAPAGQDKNATFSKLTVDAPYYPELKRGDRSDEVRDLQQKLIELGYLDGSADGQFGAMTENAVKDIEAELRAIEQRSIDAMATPIPTPAPTPDGTAEPTQPEPTQAPEPAPTPKMVVDGAADLSLQIRLNSGEFPLIGGDLTKGSDAKAVVRLQRRLIALGYLTGTADGDYGGNTRRGVRIFQHYNGLDETGIADGATQQRIFSADAQTPEHPLMTTGSAGDTVKRLQNRLIQLGFMKGTADGSYGAGTKTAIERLQTYMRAQEIEELTAQALAERAADAGIVPAQPDATAAANATDGPAPTEPPAPDVTPTIEVNGVADPLLMDAFFADSFGAPKNAMRNGDNSLDVERLQRRLNHLEYLYTNPDGAFGNGTESALRDFQKRNDLPEDGIAGTQTIEALFSLDALKALKPYVLKVSVDKQRVYAYGLDDNNEHTVLVRTMKCSTGTSATPTPKGTFQSSTGPGARWHYFKKFTCWAQYAYYIEGDIMFHSVLYGSKNGPVTSSSVRNLGRRASHGCVRLSVEDAKWLWNNCPPNTKIVVY